MRPVQMQHAMELVVEDILARASDVKRKLVKDTLEIHGYLDIVPEADQEGMVDLIHSNVVAELEHVYNMWVEGELD